MKTAANLSRVPAARKLTPLLPQERRHLAPLRALTDAVGDRVYCIQGKLPQGKRAEERILNGKDETLLECDQREQACWDAALDCFSGMVGKPLTSEGLHTVIANTLAMAAVSSWESETFRNAPRENRQRQRFAKVMKLWQ